MTFRLLFLTFCSLITLTCTAQMSVTGELCSCITLNEGDIYKVAEKMPVFFGDDCPADLPYAELKSCADKAMIDFIYGNLTYPIEAYENYTQGMAIISFVVEANGCLSNPTIRRDPGDGTGEEALRIVKLMMTEAGWRPGNHHGENVRTEFNLPIKFRIDDNTFISGPDTDTEYLVCQADILPDSTQTLTAFNAHAASDDVMMQYTSKIATTLTIMLSDKNGAELEQYTMNVEEGGNQVLLAAKLFSEGQVWYTLLDISDKVIAKGVVARW